MSNDEPLSQTAPETPSPPSGRLTRQEAEALLAEWQVSQLSLVGFARERGIDVKRLYVWRQRFRSEPSNDMRLAEVSMSASSSPGSGVVIIAPNGVRLEISSHWQVGSIAALCKALTC